MGVGLNVHKSTQQPNRLFRVCDAALFAILWEITRRPENVFFVFRGHVRGLVG